MPVWSMEGGGGLMGDGRVMFVLVVLVVSRLL